VNDVRITSDKHLIGEKDITSDGVIKLTLGKKHNVLLKPA
jgi:tyrosyl-tRNA synthetase